MIETWTQAVRRRAELGRLLPLGGPHDGTWITEQAAVRALRRSADEVPGVRLESLRIGSVPQEPVSEPAVSPPPSALPPGPLRIEAGFSAPLGRPVPDTAGRLRSTLLDAAAERLGLTAVTADLRVTDLRDAPETGVAPGLRAGVERTAPDAATEPTAEAEAARPPSGSTAGSVRGSAGDLADVANRVPGVARLTAAWGSRPVKVEDRTDPPGRRVEVHIAVAPGHHPLRVARAVRAAVAVAAATDAPGPVTVAVLVTQTAV
ncbi:hypothetical protein ACIPJS_33865 [Streptomyces sp. NPDC086783]|uniref:hypothetical protein n=1 Tax=Streptomyces sp. NPDC086783 TaxID=3365758 RepID=UPI0037F50259